MAKIEIPRIVRPLDLAEYAPEYAGAVMQVWVNPTRAKLRAYYEAAGDADRLVAWFAEIWSQGVEETRWTAEGVYRLAEHALDADPRLWSWLCARTLTMIADWRGVQKKT